MIETSTQCSCGTLVTLAPADYGSDWVVYCENCIDGTEDAGPRANIRGRDKTPELALWDWQEKHDEEWQVEWCLADLFGELARQVSDEAERQRGWSLECAGTGNPPYMCPPLGELVCGPPASLAAAALAVAW